jgi:hypothetical protein
MLRWTSDPAPAGYHLERRGRPVLVIVGSLLFVAGYIPGVGIAAASGMKGTTPLFLLPIVGPFAVVADDADPSRSHCPLRIDTTDCHATFVWPLALVMGIAQLAGVVMFGAGLFKRNVWAKDVSVVPSGFAVVF